MTESDKIDGRFLEEYHSVACRVLGPVKPSPDLLSEFPEVLNFLRLVRNTKAIQLEIGAIDAIGSAIPMLSDNEFLVVLADLVVGCSSVAVDPLLCSTLVNRFLDVSRSQGNWHMLKRELGNSHLAALKQGLCNVASCGWSGRRADVRCERVELAFVG